MIESNGVCLTCFDWKVLKGSQLSIGYVLHVDVPYLKQFFLLSKPLGEEGLLSSHHSWLSPQPSFSLHLSHLTLSMFYYHPWQVLQDTHIFVNFFNPFQFCDNKLILFTGVWWRRSVIIIKITVLFSVPAGDIVHFIIIIISMGCKESQFYSLPFGQVVATMN